ncbi:MAG: NADP-dependent glyceraldehyde-3-phosphate dehydrogenase [Vicinamibacteria bacterium]|nr:NADP-dependent glyceraldehyde-3-phosphate dehydrogenase [Vicinamibacteria bacterium]
MPTNATLGELFPTDEAIPAAHRLATPLLQQHYLCEGALRKWSGPTEDVVSPVWEHRPDGGLGAEELRLRRSPHGTGDGLQPRTIGHTPALGAEQALQVLAAASRAWDKGRGEWPTMPVAARIRCLENFTRRMRGVRDEVVRLLMWEIGKSLADSEKEFDRTVDYIRDTVEAVKDLDRASSRFVLEQGIAGQVRRAPLGVTLSMGPFNYPLNETYTTLIPALLMGNPVVFKPPRFGALLHAPLLAAFAESFPPGVVGSIHGDGRTIVGPLVASGQVDVLAFIGTSRVASLIRAQHPKPHRLRCVLGLEAKNPAIVLPDADLDLAVAECVLGALSFNGQRCTAIKLVFVHERVADAFTERLAAAVDALTPGMPWDPGVRVTPLPEPGKAAAMAAFVADAVAGGARVVNTRGGDSAGSLFFPAVVSGVTPSMRLYREEQFGPLVPVVRFSSLDEPVRAITDSDYGQQVALFGQDPATLSKLVDPLVNQVCRVNLNSQCQRGPDTFPFTGRKDSAEGTLSVSDALRVFSIRTLVAAKQTPANTAILEDVLRHRRSSFLSTDFLF